MEWKFFKLDLNFIPSNSAPIPLLHVPCSGLMNMLVLYQSLIDLTTDKSPSLSLEASSKPPVDLVVNINWKNSSATDRKAKWSGQRSPFWQSHPPGCQRELGASAKPQGRPKCPNLHQRATQSSFTHFNPSLKENQTLICKDLPKLIHQRSYFYTFSDSQVCCATQLQPDPRLKTIALL